MPKLTRKQTGSKNRKSVTGKLSRKVGKRLLNPWGGPNIPLRARTGKTTSGGSSSKQPRPDASLAPQTRGYPRNKPSQWPVESDVENYTLAPPLSGYTEDIADVYNAEVEEAYRRAGYQ